MRPTQIFTGKIVGCTRLEQYAKKNGEPGVRCVYHLLSGNGEELAVTASGELTNWVGSIGATVVVEYFVRVFACNYKNKDWYGNDVHAVNIKSI